MAHSIRTKYKLSEIAFKSGFKFRDIENRKLDWKSLGSIDVNKVIDNQDYEFLEQILPQIIEAPMQSILNAAVLDPAVASLFRLAQLSLQYLSFCQRFMDHTLYDLRSAFNHLQRKNLHIKNNYKRLEDEYNKAQKRIQMLSNGNDEEASDNGESVKSAKSTSLFSCNQCTKNFLTADSLKSHQQRKHSVFGEKHELSDENEKDISTKSTALEETSGKVQLNGTVEVKEASKDVPGGDDSMTTEKENVANSIKPNEPHEEAPEQNDHKSEEPVETPVLDSNDNNRQNDSSECSACVQRALAKPSHIGIQCDDLVIHENHINDNNEPTQSAMPQLENDLIQTAYVTINELRNDILELRNALEYQATDAVNPDIQGKKSHRDEHKLDETNEKIDVIEQKFNAFESKFMESQHQFIESFRNLDEQQKSYMNNIQATIKEIVEKSLTVQHSNVEDERVEIELDLNKEDREPMEKSQGNVENKPAEPEKKTPQKPEVKPRTVLQKQYDCSTSESDCENGEVVCRVDVHTVDSDQSDGSRKNGDSKKNHVGDDEVASPKDEARQDVLNELEQRLRHIGVDADSTGLSTPRSEKAQQNLTVDREDMVKTNKAFNRTRTKLNDEVERIAKKRLTSASSASSLSSQSQLSTDSSDNDDNSQQRTKKLQRPKTASLQNTRDRNAKKLMQKLVENDIDEGDILNKMQMAKQVINEHRECIQELLQTTAHGPNTMNQIPRIKYSTEAVDKTNGTNAHDDNSDDAHTNKFNKMPNVTTRRVVFVNLDEDS